MNAKVEKAVFAEAMPALSQGSIALSGLINPIGRGIAEIVKTLRIGQIVAYRADRYYTMNDAQLAGIGLTRDRIPAELIRLFSELE